MTSNTLGTASEHLLGCVAGNLGRVDPSALRHYLMWVSYPAAASASGQYWTCIGPLLETRPGLTAVIRGHPIWRTAEPAILQARNAADALLEAYLLHGTTLFDYLHGSFAF